MILKETVNLAENREPLESADLPCPFPADNEILVKVYACGVCHTELDEIEGRTPPSALPVIPGHQIIGRVEVAGAKARRFKIGARVGIAWIHSACGRCRFCRAGMENLCEDFKATGRDADGGYAEYTTVSEDFAYEIPDVFSDVDAAPLLCAGAIGYRALKLTGLTDGENIGLAGFGASAHLVMRMIRYMYPSSEIFVFSRTKEERDFAASLGASWTGDFNEAPPEKLKTAIDTTPAWGPVLETLTHIQKGGRLVINAIRKEERDKAVLLKLDYPGHIWMEKEIKSVANITRNDIQEFLSLAARIPIYPEVQEFGLEEANRALLELKERKIRGAKVLVIFS